MTILKFDVVHHDADRLGECPLWCARANELWWVDVLAPALYRWQSTTGTVVRSQPGGRRLGSIALRRAGGILLARDDGLFAFDVDRQDATFVCDPEPHRPDHRKNDGRADRHGRFWVGTLNEIDYRPEGSLYCVGPARSAQRVLSSISIPNALAFSPDDRTLYFADTRRYTIWAYPFDLDDGAIGRPRVFAETTAPARPDGACIDQDGCLWNAEYAGGRVVRYTPRGAIDRIVELPVSHPTSCCFGGADLDTLFVTSASEPLSGAAREYEPLAGALLATVPGVRGLPEHLTIL